MISRVRFGPFISLLCQESFEATTCLLVDVARFLANFGPDLMALRTAGASHMRSKCGKI